MRVHNLSCLEVVASEQKPYSISATGERDERLTKNLLCRIHIVHTTQEVCYAETSESMGKQKL